MGQNDYFGRERPEMAAFIPQARRRVLDVGCAEGRFLAGLPGVEETWGIEPSEAWQAAATRLDRVLHGTYEQVAEALPDGYFDVIVCNDVIEHMPDHDAFLARIGRHLAPQGVLVGSIPNVRYYENLFQMLLEKDWAYRDMGILDRTHLRFFTRKSLQRSLLAHGFRIERLEGINVFGDDRRQVRPFLYRLMARAMIVATAGYFADIGCMQFGFRVRQAG